ncbi:MAG TPA: FUN14 domain-containing protein [Nitrososphaeraceae archaeon]|nr:FUN14 domain-containing protein [Nitrososphaeraceae archaeon]
MVAENASTIVPLLTSIGFGGIVGFLVGIAIKYIIKILAVIAGLILAALMYLESQGILNVNWAKLQAMSQPVLSTLTNSLNSTTGGVGRGYGGSVPGIIHSNFPFLPTDMGLPLVGSAGLGFLLGLTRR